MREEHELAAGSREDRLFALADEVAGQQWLSIQERNALYLAGRQLLDKQEPDWRAALSSGVSNSQPALKLDSSQLAAPMTIGNPGSEPLYQQLTLSGYPAKAPAAGGENLSIYREYLGVAGSPLDLAALKSGELVLVHLALAARQRVPDTLVVDLLPTGLELENQNLAQSTASLEDASSAVQEWRKSKHNARIKHQGFRGDRYVAALDVSAYETSHLAPSPPAATGCRHRWSRCTGRAGRPWAKHRGGW